MGIAKRFGASSELGAYLDPIADKALLVSVFITLGFKGVLPAWVTVLRYSDYAWRDIPDAWLQRDYLPRFKPN